MIEKEKISAYRWGKARDSRYEALKMRDALGPEKTQADWYLECPRGDWLLWQFHKGLAENELRDILPAILRALDRIMERAVRRYALPHPVTKSWAEGWLNGEMSAYEAYALAHIAYADYASDKGSDEASAAYAAAHAALAYTYVAYVIDRLLSTGNASDTIGGVVCAASSAARAAGSDGAEAYEAELKQQANDIREEIPVWKWDTGLPETKDMLEET